MKKELFSIGRMAEINNVTIPTLRHYDALGLLSPAYTDPNTGYRYYTLDQNAKLDMIQYMKELGMTLPEVTRVFQNEDLALIESILIRKNEQIFQDMRVLKMRQEALQRAISSIERYRKSPLTGTTSLEYIDRRYAIGITCRNNFYDGGIEDYEEALIHLRKLLKEARLPHLHTYSTGTSIRKDIWENGSLIADKIFSFIDKTSYDMARSAGFEENTGIMESGMYACIYSDCYDDEPEMSKRLLQWCREKGYIPDGNYICEVMTEFNVFSADERSMFLRLQIPVEFPEKQNI